MLPAPSLPRFSGMLAGVVLAILGFALGIASFLGGIGILHFGFPILGAVGIGFAGLGLVWLLKWPLIQAGLRNQATAPSR
jgi:hypothetical protein